MKSEVMIVLGRTKTSLQTYPWEHPEHRAAPNLREKKKNKKPSFIAPGENRGKKKREREMVIKGDRATATYDLKAHTKMMKKRKWGER